MDEQQKIEETVPALQREIVQAVEERPSSIAMRESREKFEEWEAEQRRPSVDPEVRTEHVTFFEARVIHGHEVNEANRQIVITADEKNPANGNASHHYRMLIGEKGVQFLHFQDGPIQTVGVNGVTIEALLAIVMDRLDSFQSSSFSCRENALALTKIQEAVHWLQHRTNKRMQRGVEGTHTP